VCVVDSDNGPYGRERRIYPNKKALDDGRSIIDRMSSDAVYMRTERRRCET